MHGLRVFCLFCGCWIAPCVAENSVVEWVEQEVQAIEDSIGGVTERYQQCEALYENMRNSDCAKTLFGTFGRLYLKLGMSTTERTLKFENIDSEEDVFILSSGLKPRPIMSINFSDSYFEQSNWGYSLGASFFDDYAFEQVIKRGDNESQQKTVDLDTYSSMSVVSFSPSLFYSIGVQDETPSQYFKIGLGLNLMYSAVRGTAYLTEFKANTSCYALGTALVNGTRTDAESLKATCEFASFRERSIGSGTRVFFQAAWQRWEVELAASLYNHRSKDKYRFITTEMLFAVSRKFNF